MRGIALSTCVTLLVPDGQRDRANGMVGMTTGVSFAITVIEAAEQTILQRSIPFERQGRVFGFAQLVENAASPLSAFVVAPFAEAVFMPFMTDGRGAEVLGHWFGSGPHRGIALIFTIAGVLGVAATLHLGVLPPAGGGARGRRGGGACGRPPPADCAA